MKKVYGFFIKFFTRILGGEKFFDVFWDRWIANGAAYTDVKYTMRKIKKFNQWPIEWGKTAEKYLKLAESSILKIDKRNQYIRASYYFHLAQWGIYEINDYKKNLHKMSVECYKKALTHTDYNIETVQFQYNEKSYFSGYYFFKQKNDPVILLIHGADSCKEELHLMVDEALNRNLAIVIIDGPGQGEALLERKEHFAPDSEKVYIELLTYLLDNKIIIHSKIGVWGCSFGGFWAIKLASVDKRVKLCASLGGPYRMYYVYKRRVPPPFWKLWVMFYDLFHIKKGFKKTAIINAIMFVLRLPFIYGVKTLLEVKKVVNNFSLEGYEGGLLVPTLIVNGKMDFMVPPHELELLFSRIGSKDKQIKLIENSDHCCTPHLQTEIRSLVWEWFSNKWRAST